MSTATTTPRSTLSRVLAVVRLQFTNPWGIVILPWLILLAILAMNIAIWFIIFSAAAAEDRADIRDGLLYGGAGSYIFVYMLVVAVQAISGYFPFALGYGVTRRNYYLGISLTFVLLAVLFAVGMSLIGAIEEATNGWGMGGRMFTAVYFGDNWVQRGFVYFALLLFFFFIGSTVASIWVRWKATGMVVFWISLPAVLLGIAAIITFTQSWDAVGAWFATTGLIGSYAWSLVITAIAAVGGYLVLRRATPKN